MDLNLSGAVDASDAKLRAVTADGGSGDISIAATTITTTAATALLAANDLTLTLASLTNAGQLAANRDLTFTLTGDLTNTPTALIYAGHDGRLFVNGNIFNDQGAILVSNDLAFANVAGNGKNTSLVNRAGLIQSGRNLSILTNYLKNETNGDPVIGEQQENGTRYSFGQPEHAEELWDNDTPMRGRLFYEPADSVKWGRGGCREKHGDDCDVTWLDKGLWNSKEDTYGYLTLPDGSVYKAFTWNEVGSNDGKGKIWYDWNANAAMAEQFQTQYFVAKPSAQGLIQSGVTLDINATTIDNLYSSIEAGGDATITSDHLTNKGVTLYRDFYMTCLAGAEICYGYNADGSRNASADISAGSSVMLRREAVDSLSATIRSGGALTLKVASLDGSTADGSIAGYSHYEAKPSTGDPLAALGGLTAGGALFTPNPAISDLLARKGISVSGNGIQAGGVPLSPEEILAALGSSAPKPTSGGFGGTVPGQIFIYETRAEFLDASKFYGSGYFLNRVGYQPDHQILFLGDAYFENQLIDKQMREAMGYGLNRSGADPVERMKSLLDNGVDYAASHGLAFGEPLTPEQVAALDQSIVVYVKQNIGGIEVFAPVLYVSPKDKGDAIASGSMIEGNIVTVSGDTINNSGLIASSTSLNVQAATITANGGGFAAKGDLTLAASGNIALNAGTTSFNGQTVVVPTDAVSAGGNAAIQSGQNVALNGVNVTAGQNLAVSGENVNIGTATGTSVDGSHNVIGSKLQSGGDTAIVAKNDITVSGSSVAAGGDLGLKAESGNLTIQSAEASRKDGFGETTTQQKAALSSGGSTDLEAGKNVVIAGSDVKAGGNLSINAGEGVAGIATQDHASGSFGSNSFVTTTQQGSSLTSGGDTSVKAGSDILIGGSSIDAGKNLDLNAKGDVNIVAMANTNEEQTNGRIFQRTESETRATGSSLKAGGDLSAKAGNDLNIIGSKLGADGKAALSAGHDVNILAAENTHDLDSSFSEKSGGPFGKKRSWTKDEHETAVVGSSVSGKSGVDITSGNNTTIAGSKVQAGTEDRKADLNINAGGDLIVASGKDTSEHDGSKSKSGFLSKKSDKNHTYDETTVGSELGASGNVNLSAGDNVAISGSKVTAGDNIAIEGDSVSIIGAQERHESASSSKKSGFGVGSGDGFYSIYGKKEKTNSEAVTANVGSELSAGNDVSIKARESDVNIVGSKVEAGHDIAIDAARDVNILPGAESYASEEKEKRGGVGIQVKSGEGSASIGIGYRSSKDETKQGAETNARSSLKAGNDIKINAGRDANLQAAKVEAEHDVAITAERDVNLLAAQDKTNYEHMHEELFAGVTAQVSTGVVGAAKSIGNAADKLSNVNDGYSAANAGFAGLKAIDGVNNLNSLVTLDENGNAKGNVASASVGIGFEYSKSKEKNESSIPVVTDIRAGNNISIEAKSGDINSHGSQIAAGYNEYGLPSGGDGDISLKAGNDINLQSAQATNSSSSSSTSAGASIGVSAGLSITGVTTGVTGSAHAGTSKSNGNGTVQVNTHVDGTGDIRIESGRDTNLKGAVVEGETITANVGRDLNIVSVPDTGENSNKSSSIGVTGSLSGGTPKVTGVSPGVGTGSGETNWIEEQSGLVSKGEMDVYVEGNTHLGAGKIVSESGDLKLDTGTLTHEDFSGSKKYEGFDVQANIGLTEKQQPDQTSQPNISAEGTYQLDDTRQEVRATVGPGEIIIRDKDKQAELEASGQTEDLAALNRDPDKAYEITKDKHVEIEYYLSDTSVKQAFQAGKTIAETFSNVLDQMVTDGKRTPEQAALSKEMFPFLDDPNVRAALAQCAQQHGAVDFSIFSWIVPLAHAQTGCPIPVNGQIKYFSPTQAGTCLADYDQMTGVVRGVIGATGTTIAGLAGAFLLASTTAAGTDINQKFTAGDGSTVLITGKGDQPFRQILVTYPDGTTANLTIETYDDGGAVRLTSGVIGTLPMTPSQLKDMGYVLTNAGVPNVVSQDGSSTLPGDLLGNNGRPGGKRINTDLPGVNPTPDELFDKLTGGKNTVLPDGTKVGDNGVRLRPDQGQGQRLDIPANGDKPHETIHFPSK
jgi:filamentous hemagglutinin